MNLVGIKRATLCVWLWSGFAHANDFTAGGSPADIVPIDEPRVAMQSEDIVMEFEDGQWNVVAAYAFVNSSKEAVTHQVGFPEINCEPNQGYDCSDNAFSGLQTTLNGKPVAHKKGRISSKHPWSDYLGPVWLFDATFDPGATTRISHSYTVFTGGNLSWIYDIAYVVSTGRGWKGKIGSARFRVKLPVASHTVFPGDFSRPPRLVREANGEAYYLLERHNHDWVPPDTIGAGVMFTAWSDVSKRLGEDRFVRSGVKPEEECERPIDPRTPEQLQMCRNLVYALSGYPFKSEKLRRYFYGNPFDWKLEEHWIGGKAWVRGLRPIEGFDPKWIPALDRSFLRLYEQTENEGEKQEEELPLGATGASNEVDRRVDATLQKARANPEKAGRNAPAPPRLAKPIVVPKATPVKSSASKPGEKSPASAICSVSPNRSRGALVFWVLLVALGLLALRKNTERDTGIS